MSELYKKRILIVDDEPMLIQGLEKALQSDRVEVVTMETGRAALEHIAVSEYHLCFLDVFLPDMAGTDVLEKIAVLSPKTKVIMMSAGVISSAMKETIERIAYMFIAKPFDLLHVRMLARRLIEESV
ncbi:MAG: response regulator [Deltaproteobacteria bacterium]|nr:response regulator [Deltaproteobacteria bacterium]